MSPPKQEKKKEKKKPVEEEKDDNGLVIEKKKDPLEDLPKGEFDMDDWKRFFSNNDEEKSVPYFWEKFDPVNYSIWKGDYRYNDVGFCFPHFSSHFLTNLVFRN